MLLFFQVYFGASSLSMIGSMAPAGPLHHLSCTTLATRPIKKNKYKTAVQPPHSPIITKVQTVPIHKGPKDKQTDRQIDRQTDRQIDRQTDRQDKTRQDKTRQDKTRQDKTRQDKTRQDKTRQDRQTDRQIDG